MIIKDCVPRWSKEIAKDGKEPSQYYPLHPPIEWTQFFYHVAHIQLSTTTYSWKPTCDSFILFPRWIKAFYLGQKPHKDALSIPLRSHSPKKNIVRSCQEKWPFSIFFNGNHECFLSNPYSSLGELGDIEKFKGDINLESAQYFFISWNVKFLMDPIHKYSIHSEIKKVSSHYGNLDFSCLQEVKIFYFNF